MADVLFYYPQHFNRINGENPYFKPLIEACKNHGISYIVVEEPDSSTKAPRNKQATKFDVFLFVVLILRKLIPQKPFPNFEHREHFIGKIINLLSLGEFKADTYITLSNAMGGVLRGINPKARIFDYQHGIIPSSQPGFFENGQIADRIRFNNKEVLVYGPGFREVFMKVNPDYSVSRVHVLGTFADKMNKYKFGGTNILVTLQIIETEPKPKKWFEEQEKLLLEQLERLAESSWKDEVTVYIKSHPRSNGTYNLSKVFSYPFVKPYEESVNEFILHLTFFSTSAFDVAQSGIPTLFLHSPDLPEGKQIFLEEFGYPFPNPLSAVEWLEDLADESFKDKIEKGVLNWYERFYAPFDENLFSLPYTFSSAKSSLKVWKERQKK